MSKNPLPSLPRELPTSLRDLEAWSRKRDGFRAAVYQACYGEGVTPKRSKDELAAKLSAQTHKDVVLNHPIGPRKAQEYLSQFFRYTDDLDLRYLSALLDSLDVDTDTIEGWIHPTPTFDLFREERNWISEAPSVVVGDYGMRLHRLQPFTASRILNGYRRSWEKAESKNAPLYSSPGSALFYVLRGKAQVRFLGKPKALVVQTGECCLYNQRHPHSIRPLTADPKDTVLFDVSGSYRSGVPRELFLREYTAKGFLGTEDAPAGFLPLRKKERPALDSARYMTSFVLASARMRLEELAQHTRIKEGRLRRLMNGTGLPSLREVREIAHICRVPEQSFFHPFSKHLEDCVFDGPHDLLGNLEGYPVDSRSDFHKPSASALEKEGLHQFHSIGRPPTMVPGSKGSLEVSVFCCSGPTDPEDAKPRMHQRTPSEELVYVIKGKLGVRLRRGTENISEGTFGPGDSVWWSGLGHSFFLGEGEREARAIHCRWPFPGEGPEEG